MHISIMKIGMIAASLATLVAASSLPAAAPAPKDAIAARKAHFKEMGKAVKALKEQLRESAPNRGVLTSNAAIIAATAREQPALFPGGSGPGAGVETDALPNIWTDRATFDSLMTRMIAETGKLQVVAKSGDAAAVRAQFKATGQSCAACHRKFRSDS